MADLSSPHHSLVSIAEKHGISLDALTILLTLPETRARLDVAESAGYTHLRLVAALNLPAAAHALVQLLADFRRLSQTIDSPDLADPAYTRAADRARRTAWLLFRLSRLTPVTAVDLSHACDLLTTLPTRSERGPSASEGAAADEHQAAHSRPDRATGSLSASASSENVDIRVRQSVPVPSPVPSKSASDVDAPANRVPPVPADAAPRGEVELVPNPAPTPTGSSATPDPDPISPCPLRPLRPLPSPSLSHCVTPSLSSPLPLSLDSLTAELESIALSLGIDISDLEDPDNQPPITPEFLAALPPELAALFNPDPTDIPAPHPPPQPLGSSP